MVYRMSMEASAQPSAVIDRMPPFRVLGSFRALSDAGPQSSLGILLVLLHMPAGQLFLQPSMNAVGQRSRFPTPGCMHPFKGPETHMSMKSHDSLYHAGTAALEEDAQILKVIEAYCTSANFQPGHGSSRFPPPRFL